MMLYFDKKCSPVHPSLAVASPPLQQLKADNFWLTFLFNAMAILLYYKRLY